MYDFRLMESEGDTLLWYSMEFDISIYQFINDNIYCGWRGNKDNIPIMEEMCIGQSIEDILNEILTDKEKLLKLRRR